MTLRMKYVGPPRPGCELNPTKQLVMRLRMIRQLLMAKSASIASSAPTAISLFRISMQFWSAVYVSSMVEMQSRKLLTLLKQMTFPEPVISIPSPIFFPLAPIASGVQGVVPLITLSAT